MAPPASPASAAASKKQDGAAAVAAAKKDNGIKVLIVEDNLVNQRVLQKQLKNVGFSVTVANHGGEALDWLRETNFWHERAKARDGRELHVVLMDQEMPVMDGLACTRRIREWERSGELKGHVPIVAVTANARSEQIAALLAAGMDDVVSKPFRIPELTPKIEELAAKYSRDTATEPKTPTKGSKS
ncbi:hypothetical protein LTS18_004944 [Coniosporium uncinatum]|uniref:Uncharacterized protein n=1 Tax=Coniosporium uncinatum TaxID=93489 RepID=A0ACC3D572_9PEZI|nr:hypothetical protein LTS18_004944 [Coniosporium uncinatum]